ncbi:hypothetical protein EBT31_21040, partial [bacterium]|nr:hypothetical protein [bacterium]
MTFARTTISMMTIQAQITNHLSTSQKLVGFAAGWSAIYLLVLLEMNLEDIVHRTALRLKLNKVSGSVVHHNAVLKRGLESQGVKCEMVKGYCVIPRTKEACEHYWLRETETGLNLDIGFAVACLKSPELKSIH